MQASAHSKLYVCCGELERLSTDQRPHPETRLSLITSVDRIKSYKTETFRLKNVYILAVEKQSEQERKASA